MQLHLKSMWQTSSSIFTKLAFALVLASGVWLLTSAQASAQIWTIDSFYSTIEIHEDATITVTETIDVDFGVQKHGIYRELPVRYTDEYGNRFTTDLDIVSVYQDGQQAQVKYSYNYGFINLRIGDPDVYVTGKHQYVITYTVDRVFLYFDDYDELYWNVTGSDWEVPIDHVRANVVLPGGAEVLQIECYTGEYGSTSQDCVKRDLQGAATFDANDFLTVAVGFTKGVIYEPTAFDRFIQLISDNWYALIPLILFAGTFWIWWTKGRDPKMNKSIIAEYEPPQGIKAVHAGLLAFGKLKGDMFASMIIQMATDGILTIEVKEVEKKFGILKQNPKIILHPKKSAQGLEDAHAQLHEILFKGKLEPADLSKIKGTIPSQKLTKLRSTLQKWLINEGYYVKYSFARQAGFIVGAVALAILSIVLGSVLGVFTAVVGFLSALGIAILGYLMPSLTPEGLELKRKVLGFKEFMHTAERYRSEWQEKENIFAEYLPYAIAFNDVEKWAKTFEGMKQVQPDWYTGQTSLILLASTGQFESISHGMQQATSTPKPSSSGGSSGGGFSGGGFGGGGGGSW